MTDEPLDLAPIEARDVAVIARMRPPDPPQDWVTKPSSRAYREYRDLAWFEAEHDRRVLLAEVKRLRAQLNYWQARAESAEDKLDGQAWLDLTRDRDELRDRTEQTIAIVTEADDHPGMYRPQEILAQIRRVLDPTQPEETP